MSTPDNVIPFTSEIPSGSRTGGDGGGDDMLERVKKLEDAVQGMRTDIAIIKANHATKEDIASVRVEVHQAIANQTKWLAATMLGITGVALAIAKLLF